VRYGQLHGAAPYGTEAGSIAFPSPQWYDLEMKAKVWFNKANSFEEARDFDSSYYLNLTSAERIETIQLLREAHFKSTGCLSDKIKKNSRPCSGPRGSGTAAIRRMSLSWPY